MDIPVMLTPLIRDQFFVAKLSLLQRATREQNNFFFLNSPLRSILIAWLRILYKKRKFFHHGIYSFSNGSNYSFIFDIGNDLVNHIHYCFHMIFF